MTAVVAVTELLARLGAELDFDVARNVDALGGAIDAVWLDRRLLPPAEELREPFAFRVGRESGRRVRGLLSRGDYAVVSREPSRGLVLSPKAVYAVRWNGMVVLSRVEHQDGKLLLVPAGESGGIEMLDAPTPTVLAELIAGRVVAVLRVFRREQGEAPARRRGRRGSA